MEADIKTVGDWQDAFLSSGQVSRSQHANVKTIFRKIAKLVSGQTDPHKVQVTQLQGLRRRWETAICQKAKKTTAKQYRMWGNKVINWAVDNANRFDPSCDIQSLNVMSAEMWSLLDDLKNTARREYHLATKRLFLFLDDQQITLLQFFEMPDSHLEEFEIFLKESGVTPKTWKAVYGDALRGLKALQDQNKISKFSLRPFTTKRTRPYAKSFEEFQNNTLKEKVHLYDLRACEVVEIGDTSWPHKPVSENTHKNNIKAIQQFMGFLEDIYGINTTSLSVDEIFSSKYLNAFAQWYCKNQQVAPGVMPGGLIATMKRLKGFTRKHLNLSQDPKGADRFERIYKHKPSEENVAKKVRTLKQWWSIIKAAEKDASEIKTKKIALCYQRLKMYLLVLMAVPHRPGAIQKLKLEHNLFKEPLAQKWRIKLRAEETKTGYAYEATLPNFVTDELERYFRDVRPQICSDQNCTYVFPTDEGNHVSEKVLNSELARIDIELHQVPEEDTVYPHTMRHTVVMTFARKSGRNALRDAGKILGHRNGDTTLKFYAKFSRELADRDRQAERILQREELTEGDITNLIALLAKEPDEFRRFAHAFQKTILGNKLQKNVDINHRV